MNSDTNTHLCVRLRANFKLVELLMFSCSEYPLGNDGHESCFYELLFFFFFFFNSAVYLDHFLFINLEVGNFPWLYCDNTLKSLPSPWNRPRDELSNRTWTQSYNDCTRLIFIIFFRFYGTAVFVDHPVAARDLHGIMDFMNTTRFIFPCILK